MPVTVIKKISDYLKYCKKNKLPAFMPIDGICYNCKQQMFTREDSYPTSCPHCGKSYCD